MSDVCWHDSYQLKDAKMQSILWAKTHDYQLRIGLLYGQLACCIPAWSTSQVQEHLQMGPTSAFQLWSPSQCISPLWPAVITDSKHTEWRDHNASFSISQFPPTAWQEDRLETAIRCFSNLCLKGISLFSCHSDHTPCDDKFLLITLVMFCDVFSSLHSISQFPAIPAVPNVVN